MMNNISFQDLKEVMPKLLSVIYDIKDQKSSYEIGFLPSSDKEVYMIDNTKVRMICSALEYQTYCKSPSKRFPQTVSQDI